MGSPPRVRGKGCVIHFSCPPYGITPACAGKRAAAAPEASGHQDHPRVCGEKFDNPKIDNSQLGSPPRVRGKGILDYMGVPTKRITPACAGKSVQDIQKCGLNLDHPRVCGEKNILHHLRQNRLGSPPRVRGKVSCHCWITPQLGITPACAGKSDF